MRSLADQTVRTCGLCDMHMLGNSVNNSRWTSIARTTVSCSVYTIMRFAATSPRPPAPAPACIGLHRGNAFVTKRVLASPVPIRQRCGRIDALPRAPATSRILLTHHAPILFFLCSMLRARYLLRATCCCGGGRTLNSSQALPRARGHPRRSLGDPAGQGSLCRAAFVQHGKQERSGCGLGATEGLG